MITTRIAITSDLVLAMARLINENPSYKDCGVLIGHDEDYGEQEWLVQFDAGYGSTTFVVDDETGESRLAGLGEGRKFDRGRLDGHEPRLRSARSDSA